MKTSLALIANLFLLSTASQMIAPAGLHAATMYLDATGTGAQGDVNGTLFTGQNWTMEYAIDSTVACSPCDSAGANYFSSAITGSVLSIGDIAYTLIGDSALGDLQLVSYSGQSDEVDVYPVSGGFFRFITGSNVIFPALFTDITSLTSANGGIVIKNSVADPFYNSDEVSFQKQFNFSVSGNTPAIMTTLGVVDISASTPDDSGQWQISINSNSQVGSATPEPSSILLTLVGSTFLVLRLRRRSTWPAILTED